MKKAAILSIVTIILTITFYKLGSHPINKWDEARNGSIAIEMEQTGDYLNYYYLGKPDLWVAKPPLQIYLILVSYKFFGYNEFSLRLPSALAALGILAFTFLILRKFSSYQNAVLCVAMLLVVEGIFGIHVGRTGDFDSLFACMILAGCYFLVGTNDKVSLSSFLYSSVFFSLAFFTKGLAVFIFLPAVFLYFFASGKITSNWKEILVFTTGIFFSLFTWFLLIYFKGFQTNDNPWVGENAADTMFIYDVWNRFTGHNFPGEPQPRLLFFPMYLDAKFSVFYLLFYVALLAWGLKFILRKSFRTNLFPFIPESTLFSETEKKLLTFSFIFWLVPAIILTASTHKFGWYFAPALPFLAIFTVLTLDKIIILKKYLPVIILAPALVLAGLKFYKYSSPKQYPDYLLQNEDRIKNCARILVPGEIQPDDYLWMLFRNQHISIFDPAIKWCEETADLVPQIKAKCTCKKEIPSI